MRILVSAQRISRTALIDVLGREGHTIVRLVRPGTGNREVSGARRKPSAGILLAANSTQRDRRGADAWFIWPARPSRMGDECRAEESIAREPHRSHPAFDRSASKLKQPPRVM